ncbi:hypothetical protein [Dolichospermum flos-aquae]|uniref:Uncharacterized protein n=1 Tax=Dolichospermum flos-aquae CCAP 1403/13F TaxID=315271 RepID=A0A6H2C0Y0_DOLFA|nr:hypothetical protein [Dolichospermum flos-aquae]QJB45001.1 hypothetical protein HGD76_13270 [Dolichospermum flos-aquae CCAP 1403/13F]
MSQIWHGSLTYTGFYYYRKAELEIQKSEYGGFSGIFNSWLIAALMY